MIPEIGMMIGAYIITRMFALIFTRIDAQPRILAFFQVMTKVAAGVTILVAVVVMVDLLFRGTTLNVPTSSTRADDVSTLTNRLAMAQPVLELVAGQRGAELTNRSNGLVRGCEVRGAGGYRYPISELYPGSMHVALYGNFRNPNGQAPPNPPAMAGAFLSAECVTSKGEHVSVGAASR
jgi:hypothetical protein